MTRDHHPHRLEGVLFEREDGDAAERGVSAREQGAVQGLQAHQEISGEDRGSAQGVASLGGDRGGLGPVPGDVADHQHPTPGDRESVVEVPAHLVLAPAGRYMAAADQPGMLGSGGGRSPRCRVSAISARARIRASRPGQGERQPADEHRQGEDQDDDHDAFHSHLSTVGRFDACYRKKRIAPAIASAGFPPAQTMGSVVSAQDEKAMLNPAPFEIDSQLLDGVHVISVRGELDLNTARSWRSRSRRRSRPTSAPGWSSTSPTASSSTRPASR